MAQDQLGQNESKTLSQKYPTPKKAGKMAQVVLCLTSKHEALSSNPSTAKKKKKKGARDKRKALNNACGDLKICSQIIW
jgi:hypothetical protein